MDKKDVIEFFDSMAPGWDNDQIRNEEVISLILSKGGIAKGKQVLCVTHLAQIAVYGNNHLLIEKNTGEDNTYTSVRSLDENERINEIARIIGGDVITEKTLSSAEELISYAKN